MAADRTPKNPAAEAPRPRRAVRASVPGGPSSAAAPAVEEDGKTSPQLSRERAAEGTTPGPETAPPPSLRGQAAVRARVKTPAGAETPREGTAPAGSRGLRGAEWQAAVRAAQSKRRRPVSSTTAKPTAAPPLPPVTTGTALTATANCIGRCDWTAGPGDPAEVDKAAEKHTTKPPRHPTSVVSKVAGEAA